MYVKLRSDMNYYKKLNALSCGQTNEKGGVNSFTAPVILFFFLIRSLRRSHIGIIYDRSSALADRIHFLIHRE